MRLFNSTNKEMAKLSNGDLTKKLLEKYKDDELVNELLIRYDHALSGLEEPSSYYREDVTAFAAGKKTRLEKAD